MSLARSCQERRSHCPVVGKDPGLTSPSGDLQSYPRASSATSHPAEDPMDQSPATISRAANQAASTGTDQTAPLGRAGAARRGSDPGRLIVIGVTALALLGLFVSLLRVPEPHNAPLYWDLPPEDSGTIVGRLEALGTPFPT